MSKLLQLDHLRAYTAVAAPGPTHTCTVPRCKMAARALIHTQTNKIIYFKLKKYFLFH